MTEKVLTDLESMLNRATDPETDDLIAVDMFCTILKTDTALMKPATELILNKIKSPIVAQSLKAIKLLDECMAEVGPDFQSEVGKFRSLNELIRLVSKQYAYEETPQEIRKEIFKCIILWTVRYPHLNKIKDTLSMLQKEGDPFNEVKTTATNVSQASVDRQNKLMDGENEQQLKKLIQSKNPYDVAKANLLIRSFVDQDTRKNELKIARKNELKNAKEMTTLLNVMLENLKDCNPYEEENSLEVMREIYSTCKKSKINIERLLATIDGDDDMLGEAIEVNDDLQVVMDRFKAVQKHKSGLPTEPEPERSLPGDLLTNLEETSVAVPKASANVTPSNTIQELFSIFSEETEAPLKTSSPPILKTESKADHKYNFPDFNFFQIDSNESQATTKKSNGLQIPTASNMMKPMTNIDIEKSLEIVKRAVEIRKNNENPTEEPSIILEEPAVPTNSKKQSHNNLDSIIGGFVQDLKSSQFGSSTKLSDKTAKVQNDETIFSKEEKDSASSVDILTDCENGKADSAKSDCVSSTDDEEILVTNIRQPQFIPLSEIDVCLNSVEKRHEEPPYVLMQNSKGLNVTLNYVKTEKPSLHVSVIVVWTVNNSPSRVEDYQFSAFVTNPCKVRLLAPSANSLAGLKPFRSPDSIHQILLLLNPTREPVDIQCFIKYRMEDDPDQEPFKELVVAKNIKYFD